MTTAEQMAAQLLKSVQDMISTALRPFDEQERRTAGLLAQTRDEAAQDRIANHETEREIKRRIDAIVDSVTERLRALEGTGNGTASPAYVSVVDLQNTINAVAKRIDLLEGGRTGPREIAPGQYEYQPTKEDMRAGHVLLRHGPPPGVPLDPTTANLERLTKRVADAESTAAMWARNHDQIVRERDELLAACERKNTKLNELTKRATDAERVMTETVASQVRVNDDMRAKLERSRREVTDVREQLEASSRRKEQAQVELRKATEMLENVAIRSGVQPIGSREQNADRTIARLEELNRKLEIVSGARDEAEKRERANAQSCAEFAQRVRDLEARVQARGKLDDTRIERLAELEGKQGITRARAVSIAVEAAAADRIQTYTAAKPFVPHEWVVQAVMRAGGGEVADPDQPEPGDSCDCPSRPGTYDIAHVDGCPLACTCGALADGQEHKIGCPEMPF